MTREDVQKMLQAALRRRRQAGLHVAAGRHRQHDPRVRRQRDVGVRLRRRGRRPAATSRRPTVRTASRSTNNASATAAPARSSSPVRSSSSTTSASRSGRPSSVTPTSSSRREMLNAFNHPNFLPVNGVGATLERVQPSYQLTALRARTPAASSRSSSGSTGNRESGNREIW